VLGLKFADRTFRFANIDHLNNGPELTAAGAGLLPFNAKLKGQICSAGSLRLIEALDRALDKAEIERGDAVVILDGRSVLRTVFPLLAEKAENPDILREQARWELSQRWNGPGDASELKFEGMVRGRRGETAFVDVWAAHPEIFKGFERVVEAVGCTAAMWDCDQWALTRLFESYSAEIDCTEPSVVALLEADSLEIALVDDINSVGVTTLKDKSSDSVKQSWNPDDPESVATEIIRCMQELSERWPAGWGGEMTEASRLFFTGSVEEPERLLASLVRSLSIRVEMMELQKIFKMDDSLQESPLIQSNLGAFALCTGGALLSKIS
jgi:hypothetical protein